MLGKFSPLDGPDLVRLFPCRSTHRFPLKARARKENTTRTFTRPQTPRTPILVRRTPRVGRGSKSRGNGRGGSSGRRTECPLQPIVQGCSIALHPALVRAQKEKGNTSKQNRLNICTGTTRIAV